MLNKNKFKVLSMFSGDYKKEVYGREAARELSMNQKTVSNVLKRLEKDESKNGFECS
jgi:DNA-binding MarR family transcriptional regulator